MSVEPAASRDPFLKSILRLERRGTRLDLMAPHSVFSNTYIDRGTLLLLDHIPDGEPRTFLDLGCGYGALGLPLACEFPAARGLLVDRDLLAVAFARKNAIAHRIRNVSVVGSLGYRDISPAWPEFDWILANLPARAGESAFAHFLAEGSRRLTPEGQMRVVVIAPLADTLQRAADSGGLSGRKVAATEQHVVFAFSAQSASQAREYESPYERDRIEIRLPGLLHPLSLLRPTDLADEPHRLSESIPFLTESVPSCLRAGARILVIRSGYGLVVRWVLERFPEASVVAVDRDLLGTDFTRKNCSMAGERLRVIEAMDLSPALEAGPYDLVLGELLPPLGLAATLEELGLVRRALASGGEALIAGLKKQWRENSEAGGPAVGWERVCAGGTAQVCRLRA